MLKFVQLVFLTGLILSGQLLEQVWAGQTADPQWADRLLAFDSDAGDPKEDPYDQENMGFMFTPKAQVSHLRTQNPILPKGKPTNAKSNPHAARAPPELI